MIELQEETMNRPKVGIDWDDVISDLNSIAGDTIELEKPVIGIIEPAPATLPNFEYTFIAVRKAPKNINEIVHIIEASSLFTP